MAPPKKVDYDRIEPGWRAGILSPRQLADAYTKETGMAVSHTAIINHFKRQDVPRDLGAKIRAKADAIVTAAIVDRSVTPKGGLSERQIVDGNASVVASVLLSQQEDIGRGRTLFRNLLTELEGQVADPGLFEQLGELMDTSTEADDEGGRARQDKLNEIYRKVISMPGRVDSAKKLTETLEKLVKMEREAFGMNTAEPGAGDPQAGGKPMTDVERAVRLMHFMQQGATQ